MIYKLQQIFNKITLNTNLLIKGKEQFDQFLKKLLERKILIEHDIPILNKYIIDFPVSFEQFCAYIEQIYKLDIEHQIESKFENFNDTFSKVVKYLNFYSYDKLTNDDISEILKTYQTNQNDLNNIITNFKKIDFLLKNIRDDLQKFLWDKIYENEPLQNIKDNPEFFIIDPSEYQQKMQAKIEYEYEIIKTKKVHYNSDKVKLIKKVKKIKVERAFCADRDIPIQCWKIPNNFFDRELLSNFYCNCEALRELLLSVYFQKFLGFDDVSSDDFQYFYFENLEGQSLANVVKNLALTESSLLFKYLAKEILCSFRDLLYKCTHSISFPITIDDFSYDVAQLRLYIHNIRFGPKRKTILQSQQIVEAKLLYYYGIILINLLSFEKPELHTLVKEIESICHNFKEFEQMQKIFDHIYFIEETLTKHLEDDVIISIIIESLISPYKAKIVFDEFYESKNFIKEICINDSEIEAFSDIRKINNPQKKHTDVIDLDTRENDDKLVALEPYYEASPSDKKLKEEINEVLPKKSMTINLLLIHPFYLNTNYENSFVSFLFKK